MRRFSIVLTVAIAVGLLTLFLAGGMFGRNDRRLGQNDTNLRGQNLTGDNRMGTTPNASPNGGVVLGPNRGGGGPNNPIDATGVGTDQGRPDYSRLSGLDQQTDPQTGGIAPVQPYNSRLSGLDQQVDPQTGGFDMIRADNIRNQLAGVDGISRVNTVINGNTALIGYSPTNQITDVDDVRNRITDRVRQTDNTITNVVVSGSEDISSRIGRLADNIRNSRPVNDLNNEFNQLMQNLRPAGQ